MYAAHWRVSMTAASERAQKLRGPLCVSVKRVKLAINSYGKPESVANDRHRVDVREGWTRSRACPCTATSGTPQVWETRKRTRQLDSILKQETDEWDNQQTLETWKTARRHINRTSDGEQAHGGGRLAGSHHVIVIDQQNHQVDARTCGRTILPQTRRLQPATPSASLVKTTLLYLLMEARNRPFFSVSSFAPFASVSAASEQSLSELHHDPEQCPTESATAKAQCPEQLCRTQILTFSTPYDGRWRISEGALGMRSRPQTT
jgi:hypothetical protein